MRIASEQKPLQKLQNLGSCYAELKRHYLKITTKFGDVEPPPSAVTSAGGGAGAKFLIKFNNFLIINFVQNDRKIGWH